MERYGWEAPWKFRPPGPDVIFDIVIAMKPGNTYPKDKDSREEVAACRSLPSYRQEHRPRSE